MTLLPYPLGSKRYWIGVSPDAVGETACGATGTSGG